MSEGEGGALARLAHSINTARHLTQHMRGGEMSVDLAHQIAAHLKAAQRLVQGKPAEPPVNVLIQIREVWEATASGRRRLERMPSHPLRRDGSVG